MKVHASQLTGQIHYGQSTQGIYIVACSSLRITHIPPPCFFMHFDLAGQTKQKEKSTPPPPESKQRKKEGESRRISTFSLICKGERTPLSPWRACPACESGRSLFKIPSLLPARQSNTKGRHFCSKCQKTQYIGLRY